MKALVKHEKGEGNLSLTNIDEPALENSHSVKIKVAAAGICGTDIKILEGKQWCNAPVTVGHEFSGIVAEVGSDVKNVKPGDRVIAETGKQICGNCYFCNNGQSLMCDERLSIGYGMDGAMAEYIVTRDAVVHKVPDAVSLDEAALAEPAANAVHVCCDRVNILPGDTVYVMGPGAIGLLCAQVAKSRGAVVTIVGIDADKDRLKKAAEIGIDRQVNSQQQDLIADVNELTGGMGADIVIEASGSVPGVKNGLSILRKGGTMVQIGLTHGEVAIDWQQFPQKEITVTGSFGHNWSCWERALKLISLKKINVKDMISHRFDMEDWEEGFKIAKGTTGMKVLLYPSGK